MDLSKTSIEELQFTNSDKLTNESCGKPTQEQYGNSDSEMKTIDVSNSPRRSNNPAVQNITILSNIEKAALFQKELKKVNSIDEMETIEERREMVTISNTKKRPQILMSRNQSLNNFKISDSKSDNGSYIETNIRSLQIKLDDIDHSKTESVNDQRNKKRKYNNDSQKTFDIFQNHTPKNTNNDITEENFLEKARFEEIEDKLEEMFAGIEDEKVENGTSEKKNVPKKSNDSSDKYLNGDKMGENCLKYESSTSHKSSLPTKAAKKATLLYSAENAKQLNLLFSDHKNHSIPKSMLYLKTMTPRRRHSIGVNKELLKLSVKKSEVIGKKRSSSNITGKNVSNSKIKVNNQRRCSKYKKDITYIKSSSCSSKKIIRKFEAPNIKVKKNQQKIKDLRMQRLLSFDNEVEEKQLQTRDIETKNRSPFILVKNNGSIAVVNNVTPDDSNEKFTRAKKPANYVYERKTVKGCHSSTLSNRYDAETADSSWKCVFCKLGPHKKGLGDLFGPYIISSDCDEYRSSKNSLDIYKNFQRNDATQNLNFSNKSVKFISDKSNSHIRNISECSIYAFGMSQVSVDCYETWVHEECAIWAPNIFVVGSRLAGLEEGTWSSIRYECVYCLKKGALLCCLHRDCKTTSHVPCAREFKWVLDESKFWAYCSKHA